MSELKASKEITVRFSEVDMMNVVWHGAYPLYLEDAREAFGEKYGLSYRAYIDHRVYAPIVDMQIHYKAPMRHGMHARVDVIYRPCEAAKVIFDYEIRDAATEELLCTARTVQVFMGLDYKLMFYAPEFYDKWKEQWHV